MYLNTSSDVTIRVGRQLQLNCTIVGAANLSKVQLFWYRDNQRLTNLTRKLSTETIQLVIDQVGWTSNGTYVCSENDSNRVQPKSVMIFPAPPQDVWINNVEFRTYIHWKAPLHPGGLQLNYAIKGKCKNASNLTQLPECEQESITLCEVIDHGPDNDQFVLTAILHQFAIPVPPQITYSPIIYLAFVEASNELGFRRSNPVEFTIELGFNVLLTTPQPAVFLAAEEVAPPGTVKLTWKDSKRLRPKAMEYTIRYHKEGDRQNKSLTVKPPRTNYLISGLVGDSRYHFYLLVRYGVKRTEENTTTYGIYSKAAERTVTTNISAPRSPALITNCSHWSNLSRDPGLTITWTISQTEYFNGPLKLAVIFYRCQRGRGDILIGNVTVSNVTAHKAVITAVKPSDKCHVWMKLCNETWTVQWHQQHVPHLSQFKRRRNNGKKRSPLSNVLVMPAVIHGYDEIEQPLLNNNLYDVINVESLE
ncbi:hypothetical protein OS493_031307 [Desmophyllum pertusum]|uniref:Uncharacterized protein n=1 Tax=Desmophyllum pertusum TaxID=174260 RepID=A0A9X0CNT4_9CNID|nr:hypothetical protein OS493_031307 [Desmophyllum pertusum]